MEKISRELLMKEVSSRLLYGIKAQVQGWDEDKQEEVYIPLTIYSINTDGYVYFEDNNYDVDYCSVENCLLYLRPMSSITEEEKEELFNLSTMGNAGVNTCWESFGVEIISTHPRYGDHYSTDYKVIDWLNKKMFDYRGLIGKGLAIEAQDGMYNNKEKQL